MKTGDIQKNAMRWLKDKGHDIVALNFSGAGLQECDIISLNPKNMVFEYEVKVSRSDFFRDFKTKTDKHRNLKMRKCTPNPMYSDWVVIPNYFSFLVPIGLIKVEEVPEYAGLYTFEENRPADIQRIKSPKRLHTIPATEPLRNAISRRLTNMIIYGNHSYPEKKEQEIEFQEPPIFEQSKLFNL